MKTYHYSFTKVLLHYWFLFVMAVISVGALLRVGEWHIDNQTLIFIIFGLLPLITMFMIPFIAIYVLIKTKITINERHLIRKRFNKTTKIEWNKVSSIERVKKYTITFDEPKDLKITTKDGKDIYIYGYLENFNNAIEEIKRYSGIEF